MYCHRPVTTSSAVKERIAYPATSAAQRNHTRYATRLAEYLVFDDTRQATEQKHRRCTTGNQVTPRGCSCRFRTTYGPAIQHTIFRFHPHFAGSKLFRFTAGSGVYDTTILSAFQDPPKRHFTGVAMMPPTDGRISAPSCHHIQEETATDDFDICGSRSTVVVSNSTMKPPSIGRSEIRTSHVLVFFRIKVRCVTAKFQHNNEEGI